MVRSTRLDKKAANFALLQEVNFWIGHFNNPRVDFVEEFEMTGDKLSQRNIFPVKYRKVRYLQPYGVTAKPRAEFSIRFKLAKRLYYGNVLFLRASAVDVYCCCAMFHETPTVSRGLCIRHAILIRKRVMWLANCSVHTACVLLLRRQILRKEKLAITCELSSVMWKMTVLKFCHVFYCWQTISPQMRALALNRTSELRWKFCQLRRWIKPHDVYLFKGHYRCRGKHRDCVFGLLFNPRTLNKQRLPYGLTV